MSGSTSAKRDRVPRRRRTGLLPARCGRGSPSAIRQRSGTARSGTARTIPPWSGGAKLRVYRGRTVPVKAFIADLRADLGGATVRQAVADAYRSAELRDTLPWALTIVRVWQRAGRQHKRTRVPVGGANEHASAPRESLAGECHQRIDVAAGRQRQPRD